MNIKIDPQDPSLGELVVLDYDTEIFGFPVAEWELPAEAAQVAAAAARFEQRATEAEVRLVSCKVPADDYARLHAVQQAGFKVVDCVVSLTSHHARKKAVTDSPLRLRLAQAEDLPALEQIALSAFTTGRYFADQDFPAELAQKRYAAWARNAVTGRVPGGMVLVAEYEGKLAGFLVEKVEDGHSQGQLACVNPEFRNGIFMYALLVAHGDWMRENGILKATTGPISLGLMQVINLNLSIHSTLNEPEYILHWHSPRLGFK
jgi:hypothetical protein